MPIEPDAVTLTWTPRSAELADAALERDRDTGGTGARAVLAVLVALLAATMLTNRWTLAYGITVGVVALMLVFFRVTAPLARRRYSAMLTANPLLAETCTVTFDASGVHVQSDRVRSTRTWSAFPAWSDTPHAVVLATSHSPSAHTLVVPHRAASDEELAELRRVVEHHLGPAEGDGPGRRSRTLVRWGARVVVVACLLVPLVVVTTRVHDEGGEWRLWPSEAPPRLTRYGATYDRQGGPVAQPATVTGSDYTPGGGLVMVPFPPVDAAPPGELWVLDHRGTVRHYVRSG